MSEMARRSTPFTESPSSAPPADLVAAAPSRPTATLAGALRAVPAQSERPTGPGASPAIGYLIDRDVRVLAVEPGRHAGLLTADDLAGLSIEGGRLVPADTELLDRWKARVNQVVTSGKGCLFMLGKQPADGTVGLAPGPQPGTAHVRLVKPSVLDTETAESVARLAGMSARETQVFGLLLAGLPPKQISGELRTSLSTVRSQVKSVLAKTGYKGMRELIAAMARMPSIQRQAAAETDIRFTPFRTPEGGEPPR